MVEWEKKKLFEDLREIYYKKDGCYTEWESEKDAIQSQIFFLEARLSEKYSGATALARGGSGIILKVQTETLYNQERVIKFPRPLKENAEEFSKLLEKEIKLLSTIKCRNIVSIHEAGKIDLQKGKEIAKLNYIPYYVMDFVEGEDSDIFFNKNSVDPEDFLSTIKETLDGISHLHRNKLVHVDIKPSNIRIDRERHPIILDLGTTKEIIDSDESTKIGSTPKYACQKLNQRLLDKKDPDRAEGEVKRREINPIWDLHSLSLTIREWLTSFTDKLSDKFSLYQKKYIQLFCLRLFQDDYTEAHESKFGLPLNMLRNIRYNSIDSAYDDFSKIFPGISIGDNIPELNTFNFKTIKVTSGDSTPFTDRVNKTLEHPFLRRLSEISQLGIIKLIYPTATHTRLEHSLGTYNNAIKLINTLYNDPLNPIFRQLLDLKHYRATLLAALIHDIGHFPLAHDLEEIDDKLFNHRNLTTALIKGERAEKKKGCKRMEFPKLTDIFIKWEVTQEDVLSILEAKLGNAGSDIIPRILKSIISGPLDADKIDYLFRDSTRLNVPYPEGVDIDRFLKCLTLIVKSHTSGVLTYIGVHEKGIVPAEFLILSRYAMFSQVYWHHTVRAVKSMLYRSIASIIDSFGNNETETNSFKSEFEQFVLFRTWRGDKEMRQDKELFPGVVAKRQDNDEHVFNETDFCKGLEGVSINERDRMVLKYLRDYLDLKDLPEVELIDNILNRSLFKRAYVYDFHNNKNLWDSFSKKWDAINAIDRKNMECRLDQAVLSEIQSKLGSIPDTIYVNAKIVSKIETHIKAKKPFILIDFPPEKPGSSANFEYIKEQDRRELRKSDRICGHICESSVWKEYAENLRKKAGRIRVFLHPDFIDTVMAFVDSHWMEQQLSDLDTLTDKG